LRIFFLSAPRTYQFRLKARSLRRQRYQFLQRAFGPVFPHKIPFRPSQGCADPNEIEQQRHFTGQANSPLPRIRASESSWASLSLEYRTDISLPALRNCLRCHPLKDTCQEKKIIRQQKIAFFSWERGGCENGPPSGSSEQPPRS
jgi:hypothetical protein